MRRWMRSTVTAAVLLAGTVHAQSAPTASDSWQRPASSSSAGAAYGSRPATTAHESHSAFRFKDDEKADPRFQVTSPKRRYGRPDNICEANPTASTCRQAPPPRPGQGF